MSSKRLGEILIEMGVLTKSQVRRILEHQQRSRQKFGQIAVAWGWAKPQDVWQAWARQLSDQPRRINLDEIGLDTEALSAVPVGIARSYKVLPIRAWGENLVVAVPETRLQKAQADLPLLINRRLYFCLADEADITAAIEKAYSNTIPCHAD